MDFKEIDYVLAVAQTGSFTEAAKSLYISQPSLSQYIQKIEKQLGQKLFERGKKKIALTDAGREYVDISESILLKRRELRHKLDDLQNLKTGHLSLGITTQRGVHILPKLMAAFKNQYPMIEITLSERNSSFELEELLIKGLLDVVILNFPFVDKKFSHEIITMERIFLAVNEGDLAKCKNFIIKGKNKFLSFKEFSDTNFILMPKQMKLRALSEKLCANSGFTPKILLETYNIDTAQYMVSEGLGVTFVLETLMLNEFFKNRPIYIPFRDKNLSMPLVVATPENRYISNATKAFIAIAKDFYKNTKNSAPEHEKRFSIDGIIN